MRQDDYQTATASIKLTVKMYKSVPLKANKRKRTLIIATLK